MAIVQISQIQIRRGLQQDLPQLASAEMGWSLDTRRLFIGNGTTEEGAPTQGVTEILTEYSNFLGFVSSYTFMGTDSGYTSQTGISALSPVTRSIQSALDDIITVKDFGAKGDGVTDDTAAVQRAIQQIYVSILNGVHPNVQRTIKFPAGNYLITSPILIPPNCTLVGDGKNNSIITTPTGTVFNTCDSLFQISGSIGTNSAITPSNILVTNMQLVSQGGISPVLIIDSAQDVIFNNVVFVGPSTIPDLVITNASTFTTTAVSFDGCVFNGGSVGFTTLGGTVGIRIKNSTFTNCTTYGISVNSYTTGLVSQNNYFSNVTQPIYGMTGNNYSFGDTITSSDHGGLYSGAAKIGIGQTLTLNAGTTTLKTLANGSGTIDYQIQDNTTNAYRFGTLKYSRSNGVCTFDEDYTEPSTSLGANVFANSTGTLSCTVTNASTFKYNVKQFII